jgi:thymidylate synthase (FAD)
MRETTPSIHLIARPSIDVAGMREYLEDVGGAGWLDRRPAPTRTRPTARSCSSSSPAASATGAGSPASTRNVTRVRDDQREYLENLLRSLHGSVLEHASYTFAFRNVSGSSPTSSSATGPGRRSARRASATCG